MGKTRQHTHVSPDFHDFHQRRDRALVTQRVRALAAGTRLSVALLFITGCQAQIGTPYMTEGTFAEICEGLPGEENAKLPLSDASDD